MLSAKKDILYYYTISIGLKESALKNETVGGDPATWSLPLDSLGLH